MADISQQLGAPSSAMTLSGTLLVLLCKFNLPKGESVFRWSNLSAKVERNGSYLSLVFHRWVLKIHYRVLGSCISLAEHRRLRKSLSSCLPYFRMIRMALANRVQVSQHLCFTSSSASSPLLSACRARQRRR